MLMCLRPVLQGEFPFSRPSDHTAINAAARIQLQFHRILRAEFHIKKLYVRDPVAILFTMDACIPAHHASPKQISINTKRHFHVVTEVPATPQRSFLGSVSESFHHARCQQTSDLAADLIARMLDPNPATRPDAAGVVAHPWFRRGLDPGLAGLNSRLILAGAGLTAEELPGGCLNSAEVCLLRRNSGMCAQELGMSGLPTREPCC